jgi:hypothetical protein
MLALNQGLPVRLPGNERLHLVVLVGYTISEEPGLQRRWTVTVSSYTYSIFDSDQQELLAFHWHPDSRSSITHPHLHISAGARVGYAPLQKAHVPSGHVALQEVLRFAITDLGVEPLIDRDEAMHLLSG